MQDFEHNDKAYRVEKIDNPISEVMPVEYRLFGERQAFGLLKSRKSGLYFAVNTENFTAHTPFDGLRFMVDGDQLKMVA